MFPTVARLCPTLRRPPVPLVRLTSVPSPFFLNHGEVPRTGTRSGRSPVSLPRDGDRGPPWAGAARGRRARGPGPRPLPLENNSLNQYFQEFCKEAPVFL
jgi:hypothetical protein